MNTLYLIGGSARSGKSTILNKLIQNAACHATSTDSLRAGIRKALLDESYISVDKLSFTGELTFRKPGEPSQPQHQRHFFKEVSEDEITWQTAVGLIEHHDRNDTSLALEGIAITPERVQTLKLKNLKIKAVFVGFTSSSAFEHILGHSVRQQDWIYTVIHKEQQGDDTTMRSWLTEEMEKSLKTAEDAKKLGYPFFQLDGANFEGYCNNVVKELLASY